MTTRNLLKNLDWEIKTEPIQVNGGISIGKKAIIRSDNNKILGVVGENYKPVLNSTMKDLVNEISKSGEFELEGYREYYEGKVIHCFMRNTNSYLNMNGHMVHERMGISNSHDGSKRFSIFTYTAMERCGNIYADYLNVFSKKHLSNLYFDSHEVKELLRKYKSKKDSIYTSFDGMDKIKIDEGIIEKLIADVYNMLSKDSSLPKTKNWRESPSMQNLLESINIEMGQLGNNLFGLFNGVTYYTSHQMRNADSELSKINGTAHLINQKAYKFCNNIKRQQLKVNS